MVKEFFTPVKAGTLDKGLKASAAYAAKYIGKEFDVAPEFVTCVIRTFSKALHIPFRNPMCEQVVQHCPFMHAKRDP